MGLLDWLTDGGASALNPMGDATGGSAIAPPMPPGMPPVQQTGEDSVLPGNFDFGQMPLRDPSAEGSPAAPSAGMMPSVESGGLPAPPAAGMMPSPESGGLPAPPSAGFMPPQTEIEGEAGRGGMNRGTGLPPSPGMTVNGQPVPVRPISREQFNDPGRPPGPPLDVTSAVQSYQQAGGNLAPPPEGGSKRSNLSLLRAIGVDENTSNRIRGSLGAGLKSVGENANKPGLAAFAGSAGAGIEGGKKADDKTTEQQDKYLQRAIAAKREGNQAEYQKNYLRYQIESTKARLAASKEKAAGKDSVMNSPEQLYLRAVGATNQDGGLKVLANKVREAQKLGPDSPEAKAAAAEYEKKFKEVRDGHLGTLGVDPSKIKGLESKPGFSDKNPVKEFPKDTTAAWKTFDALPEGAYFINPKDQKLLIKKGSGGGAQPNPAQQSGASADFSNQAGAGTAAPAIMPPIPPVPTSAPVMAMAEEG